MKKKKTLKIVIITIIMVILLLIGIIVYEALEELKQEEILKQEIINYSNKDLASDDYEIIVKTTGDCAYIEETVKKFYKKLSGNVKTINRYLKDEKLTSILSIENLAKDQPDFTMSHATIKTTKTKINEAINNISNLCDEQTVKNLLDKDKLDDPGYYQDLYSKLMYTKQDLKDLAETKKEMEKTSTNMNAFLDKIDEILNFLEKNNSSIEYTSEGLLFKTDSSYNEYKRLNSELEVLSHNIEASSNSSEKSDSMQNM